MLLTKESQRHTTEKKVEKEIIKIDENSVVQNFKNYFELSNRWFKVFQVIKLEDEQAFPQDVQVYYCDKTGEKFLRRNENNKDFISSFELCIDKDFNLIYKEYNFFSEIKKKNTQKAYKTFEDLDLFLEKMCIDKTDCAFNVFDCSIEYSKYYKSKFSKSPLFAPKIKEGELIFGIASENKIMDEHEDLLVFINFKKNVERHQNRAEICIYKRPVLITEEMVDAVNAFSLKKIQEMNIGSPVWYNLKSGIIDSKLYSYLKDEVDKMFSSKTLELESIHQLFKSEPRYVFFIDKEDSGILYYVPFLYFYAAYKAVVEKKQTEKCLLIPVMEEEENPFE